MSKLGLDPLKIASTRVLVLTNWFEPAYKAGGPVRSIINILNLGIEKMDFWVMANNFDLDGKEFSIQKEVWHSKSESIQTYYVGKGINKLKIIYKQLRLVQADVLYINTIFSPFFTFLPLLLNFLGIINPRRIVLAPRGALKTMAFKGKSLKKRLFLKCILPLCTKKVYVHYTSEEEENQSKKRLPIPSQFIIRIPNVPIVPMKKMQKIEKEKGELKVLYLGRIHPIKNVDLALKAIQLISKDSKIRFRLYGAIDDINYWKKYCEPLVESHPSIEFLNSLEHSQIASVIDENHILIQISDTENFGHAIYEGFAHGRPVITSHFTPWKKLESEGAGRNVSIESLHEIQQALQFYAGLNQTEYDNLSKRTLLFARNYFENAEYKNHYKNLLSTKINTL